MAALPLMIGGNWPKAAIHDDLFLVEINNEYFACQFIFCTDA